MPHIFISYSRKDEAFAHRLAQSLSDLGADIWIDVKAISAGTKWSRAIQQGLDTCDALIVVVSPDSMASTNVEDEWQYYLEQKKPVIPVLIRPAKMHFQLNRIQYVDFHRQPYDGGLRQLHVELRRHGLKLDAPPAPAATESQAAAPGMSGRGRAGLVAGAVAVIALLLVGAVLLSRGGGAGTPTDAPTPAPSRTVLSVAQPPGGTPAPTDTDAPVEPTATATEAVVTEPAADLPTAASLPTAALMPHPIVCDGAPPSRLNVGMAARVTLSEAGALSRAQNVRPAPGTDSEPRVPVPEGTEFDIIGGPECVDDFVWWFIETTSAPFVTGWTAEGVITPAGGSDYFLEARE